MPVGRRMLLGDAAEAHVLGQKGGIGRASCWRQILKSGFFKVRSAELRSAHIIVVPGSIALGFIRGQAKFPFFSRSLKTMCSRTAGQDNLCMALVAFLGRMDRPMTLSGLLALRLA